MDKPRARSLPKAGEGKRGEDGYIGYLLRQAAAAYRLRQDRAFADLGVTPPQFTVMTMLKAYPGASNADLARLALLTPQTIGVIIANLEDAGMIRRRPHQVHGRILQSEITERGHDRLQACRSRVQAIEDELIHGVDTGEVVMLRRWLAGVARLNSSS